MASAVSSNPSARSSATLDVYEDSPSIAALGETEKLLWTEDHGSRDGRKSRRHLQCLWASNLVFMVATLVLAVRLFTKQCRDPSLGEWSMKDPSRGVYSPATGAVKYVQNVKFAPALGTKTEYMGVPDDELDRRWEALYQYNRSVITKQEAQYLTTPTMAVPGTDKYLVTLEVYHNLHCLDELRKLLWPERYQFIERLTSANGTIDRQNFPFRHWDHCVNSLRESIMCSADIAPASWHVNVPFNRGFLPRLATTHTCRDFSQIQKWAEEHQAPQFDQRIYDLAELQQIIDNSDIDHSTEEDLSDQYMMFPGDKWFKYWRDHPYDGVIDRPQIYPTKNHTWPD